MVTLFLRQGETGKQVLLSFPVTTPAEKEDVTATMEKLRSISRTVTIQGAASEVMNLGQHLRGIDLAAEGELERINQLAERLEHMSEVGLRQICRDAGCKQDLRHKGHFAVDGASGRLRYSAGMQQRAVHRKVSDGLRCCADIKTALQKH